MSDIACTDASAICSTKILVDKGIQLHAHVSSTRHKYTHTSAHSSPKFTYIYTYIYNCTTHTHIAYTPTDMQRALDMDTRKAMKSKANSAAREKTLMYIQVRKQWRSRGKRLCSGKNSLLQPI